MDLFDTAPSGKKPLAALLRPARLEDVVGQEHITGPASLLARKVADGRIGSVLLYGPPGVGKTSIARALGAMTNKEFCALHATKAGVKDIRALVDQARMTPLLIFVDEIHRFSTTQLDELLALSEEGTADFIGATTENPYHALTPALVSRSTILKLEPVSPDAVAKLVRRALDHLAARGLSVEISDAQIGVIAARSGGDARRALTAIDDLTVGYTGRISITDEMIDEVWRAAPVNHDRGGDMHYDVTSAFIKSMRGSDPDATLYWLARMIHAGEDPRFIARRIMIHASEDVGLADNTALQTAVAAQHAVEKIGYPEAQIVLAHAALHIARAPKSNSSIRGIHAAMAYVETHAPIPVPLHLRDTHYKGAAALGHVGYQFPHDDARGWVEQEYAPGIRRGSFYQSDARGGGSFEQRADDYWTRVTGKPPVLKG